MRRSPRPAASAAPRRSLHTAEQLLQEMERLFPEFTADAFTSDGELRFRAGQRSVVQAMRARLDAATERDPF